MKKLSTGLGLLLIACLFPLKAAATIIIDNTSLGLYNNGLGDLAAIDGPGGFFLAANVTEGDPTSSFTTDPGIAFTAAFGADWLGGNYSGGAWSANPVAIPSGWAVNSETAIVYDFTLALASDLHIDIGVDNGILVWLNGTFLYGATAAGGASINEYDIDVLGLGAGSHSLQIIRADHGGGTGYGISVDAKELAVKVPEPGNILLFIVGLILLSVNRFKKY